MENSGRIPKYPRITTRRLPKSSVERRMDESLRAETRMLGVVDQQRRLLSQFGSS